MSMFKLPSIYHMLILWKSKNSALIAICIYIYTHLPMYLYIGVYIKGRCFRKGLNQPILGKVLHRTSTRIHGHDHLGEINHLQKGVCWRHTGVQTNPAISTMKTIYSILQPLSADISTIVWSHWPIGPSLSGEEHVQKKNQEVFFQTHLKPSWSYSQTRVINSCHQFLASLNGLAMTYRTVQPSPQRSKDFNSLPSCDGTNSIKGFHIAINSLAFHSCDYST